MLELLQLKQLSVELLHVMPGRSDVDLSLQ